MKAIQHYLFASVFLVAAAQAAQTPAAPFNAQGEKCGEVSATTAILHTRLTAIENAQLGAAIPGVVGQVRFAYGTDARLANATWTNWQTSDPDQDYCIQTKVANLTPGTKYYYRIQTRLAAGKPTRDGPVRTFATAPAGDVLAPVSFVTITGQKFVNRDNDNEGFLSYAAMLKAGVDFIVLTGDTVYYDTQDEWLGLTVSGARHQWQRMYALPALADFYGQRPGYWEKDDHDYRFDDADPHRRYFKQRRPECLTHQQGVDIFLEQHPIESPTYRKARWGKGLEVWMVEGRDYRSPNRMKDGPDKTLWGTEQKAWLKKTLLASDAMFKVLVSPTPIIGPDYSTKKDNHVNAQGFRHEGQAFLKWLVDNEVKNFYIVCGDRHWRYHSIHTSGYQEFCSGALSDRHMLTGDQDKIDHGQSPQTKTLYTNSEKIGGFVITRVIPGKTAAETKIAFEFTTSRNVIEHSASFDYVR